MERLRVDFKINSKTLTADRGVFYEETNRAVIVLPNHENLTDILSTIQHETIHFCIKDEDEIDEEMEEEIIYKIAWAEQYLD
tara:strand:- start:605 stop:850 length:246 start_codon:yes stop_codon:yes gene_type:complete